MIYIVVTLIALVFLLVGERSNQRLVWASKPIASVGFICTAFAYGAMDSTYGVAVIWALVLSFFGDVFLIPKHARKWFLAGLVAFLLGHVGYAVGFSMRGIDGTSAALAGVALLVGAVGVGRWLLPNVDATMKGPVVAYIVVISVMVTLAVGTHGHTSNPYIVVGAVMFFLSDLCVARHRFVKVGFENKIIGLPLYYGGQLVLAVSVAF